MSTDLDDLGAAWRDDAPGIGAAGEPIARTSAEDRRLQIAARRRGIEGGIRR